MKTLSTYLPKDTVYFYGYPAGEDSNFYNCVPPTIEELVSARPLICAGDGIRIVSFQATCNWRIRELLETLGTKTIPQEQIIELPEAIDACKRGSERNRLVTSALQKCVPDESLLMAQPYLRLAMRNKYRLDPALCNMLNDKQYMASYISPEFLPQQRAAYRCGEDFDRDNRDYSPCVVKISSSSSGDGVRICRNAPDLERARQEFSNVQEAVLLQEFVDAADNIGVQFAIPSDPNLPIELIGMSRQIIGNGGEFNGGVVRADAVIPDAIQTVLLSDVLPTIRARGWYGVGGFDVLRTQDGRTCIIDPNFRITAMTAFVLQSVNGILKRNMVSMTGTFKGNEDDLRSLARADDPNQLLSIIALRTTNDGFQFNGTLLFDQEETMRENAVRVRRAGASSPVLDALTNGVPARLSAARP